ncbi:hypothetical protein Tco_1234184 [Tanacetum coccineum]
MLTKRVSHTADSYGRASRLDRRKLFIKGVSTSTATGGDMDKAAATSSTYYVSVRKSEKYRNLRAFKFGQSVGGMVTMLIYFQSDSGVALGSAMANVIAGLVYSEIETDVL